MKKRLRKKKNLGEFERSYAQLTLDVGADASASKVDQLFDLLIDWAETHQFMVVVGHSKGDPLVRVTATPRRGLSGKNVNAAWYDLMRRSQDAFASQHIQSFEMFF